MLRRLIRGQNTAWRGRKGVRTEEKKLFGLPFKYDRDPRDPAAGAAAAARVRRGLRDVGSRDGRAGEQGAARGGAVFVLECWDSQCYLSAASSLCR